MVEVVEGVVITSHLHTLVPLVRMVDAAAVIHPYGGETVGHHISQV
jgi:hypothetical protein